MKIWIIDVVSSRFRVLDETRHPEYRGGFEPIPDIVIFGPEIDGDWRRRNREKTLGHMLIAIVVKTPERHLGRLRAGGVVDDTLKLEALHREGSDTLLAMVKIDTAPGANERMTLYPRHEVAVAARERGVCLFFVCPSDQSAILAGHPVRQDTESGPAPRRYSIDSP